MNYQTCRSDSTAVYNTSYVAISPLDPWAQQRRLHDYYERCAREFQPKYPAEFQEEPNMRALWKVYIVDIDTESTYEAKVVAMDEAKAKIKAILTLKIDGNVDDYDIFATRIGNVREADRDE